ncbi:MAG: hypothetical protein ACM3VV_01235 [Deltaproteobacteria bacterium]
MLGSLVMLLPFGTSLNIFSNAMAEEMNPYLNNEDSLEKYEKFYKDDSFRETYYNYHKQHHHQLEPQQLQIENEVQQSIDQEQQNSKTESLPRQSTSQQQQDLSSITQEQMHQQQIVKLKQLLAAVR